MDQFSNKKYKIERYDKNKAETVKSMKQWVTDTIKCRGGGGAGVTADRRISTFACRRTQIFIKQCRKPQNSYLP